MITSVDVHHGSYDVSLRQSELSVEEEKIWTDDIHSNEKLVTLLF